MNRDDAHELAQKITRTWPGGPNAEIWAEELEELHFGQAQATYHQLRKTDEQRPSIARFHAHYRSLTRDEDEHVNCSRCDGSGWIDAPEHARHSPHCRATSARVDPLDAPPEDCHCRAVMPCDCPAGRARQATFQRMTGGHAA